MIITKLSKKGSKVIAEFEAGEKLTLSYEIVLKFGLRKGDELAEEEIQKIILVDNKFRIKNTAFRILARRSHTRKELGEKLLKREYPPELIEDVLEELKEKKYLDDEVFAEKFVEEKSSRKYSSPLKIKMELIQKGIRSGIADKAIKQYYTEDILEANIERTIRKKMREISGKKFTDREMKEKIVRSLQYKGFALDKIISCWEKITRSE